MTTVKLGSMKFRRKLAIAALIVPGVLSVFSLTMLLIINLIFNPTFWMRGDSEPVYPTPIVISAFNIFFLLTSAAGLICMLPGIVMAMIMLAQFRREKSNRH